MAAKRRTSHVLVGAILLIALLWRGADGTRRAVQEVRSRSLDDLAVAVAGDREQRLERTAGAEYELLRAVLDHAPASEPVFVVGELGLAEQLAFSAGAIRAKDVYSLLYAVVPNPVFTTAPQDAAAMVASYRGSVAPNVVDLGVETGVPWSEYFTRSASGAGFTLWRWKGQGE